MPFTKLRLPGRVIATVAAILAVLVVCVGGYRIAAAPGTHAPTEIFQGVTYGSERLLGSAEGSGLLHWARVDLTAPGIELYVTPLERDAVEQGWQYRLSWIASVLAKERLAVAVNGMFFESKSLWKLRLPGDLRSEE